MKLTTMCIISILIIISSAIAKETISIGNASWYSKNDPTDLFEHRFNADGSRFDENAYTCAMRSRDFGHYYKITNIRNGRFVIVRHTDFGPARKYNGRALHRLIDLSKAAFAKIADLKVGVLIVKVRKYK